MIRFALLPALTLSLVAQTPAPAPKKAAAAPKPAPKEDKVLAQLGNQIIRQSDFDAFLMLTTNEQQRAQISMVAGAKDQYLKRYLDLQLLAAKARKEHMETKDTYKRMMALSEMQALIQALMARDGGALQKKIQVNDADVKAFYDKNLDKFKTPESFSARHILVALKGSPAAEGKGLTEEEAKTKLAKIQAELKAGKGWEALAKDYSDDPGSKEKAGLYENITFGSFMPEFEAAVRSQELGKVGEPVKTSYGYHLIQVEGRKPAELQPFEKAKDQAHQLALAAKQEQVMADYMAGIKKELGFSEGASASQAHPAKQAKPRKASK